jgi:hypothetical protein
MAHEVSGQDEVLAPGPAGGATPAQDEVGVRVAGVVVVDGDPGQACAELCLGAGHHLAGEGRQVGESFDREIETAIKKARAVLVLWSKASVESEWVRNEVGIGKERGVLAAAQLGDCDLPIAFRATHSELLHEEAFQDNHPGWLKVLERIGALTGRTGLASYSRALGEGSAPLLR